MWACIFATRKFTVNPMTSIRVVSSGYCTYHHCLVSEVTSCPKGQFWDLFSCPCSDQFFESMFFWPPKRHSISTVWTKNIGNNEGCVNLSGRDLKPYEIYGPSVHVTDAELHHFADEAQGSHKPRRSLNYTENEDFEPKIHEVLEDHFPVQWGDIYRLQPRSCFQGCFQCGVVRFTWVFKSKISGNIVF